jgi:hypothetical protein
VYFTPGGGGGGGRLCFKKFETEKIDECIQFIATLVNSEDKNNNNKPQVLKTTGGGAYLYESKLRAHLPGVQVQKEDEMECLITGLDFFMTEIPFEVFTYDEQFLPPLQFEPTPDDVYPYIVWNPIVCYETILNVALFIIIACQYWLGRQVRGKSLRRIDKGTHGSKPARMNFLLKKLAQSDRS